MNQRLQRFIRLQVRKRSLDQRVMGNNEGEVLVNLRRSGHIALRVQHTGVSIGEAQAVLVILKRGLQPPLRLRGIPEQIGDQSSVIVAKREDSGVADAVEGIERVAEIGLPRIAPSRQQGGRHIARARGVPTREVSAGGGELSLFDVVNREGKARQAIAWVANEQPFPERIGALFVAIGERRCERALEQIGISRIGSEGFPVVDFRRQSVSIRARDQRREIIAGLGIADLRFPRSGVGSGNRRRGGACGR